MIIRLFLITGKKTVKMWENPFYFFRIPFTDKFGEQKLKDLIVDVTKSAWSKEIKPDLKKVLNIIIGKDSDYKINSILDFGCGKFNSVNYIIRKEKNITVVDYKEILERHKYLKPRLEKLKKNILFTEMDFPNPFIIDKSKYDLCILINTLPIMPVFLERLLVLQVLNEKIKDGKYLLWYAMANATFYRIRERTNRYILGDGIWLRDKEDYKSFYHYHPPEHITLLMHLSGFYLERKLKAPSVDALLFKRTEYNLLKDIVTFESVSNLIKCQMVKEKEVLKPITKYEGEINPYPEDYNFFNLIKKCYHNLKPGIKDANYFKRLSAGVFQFLFFSQLTGMELEDKIDNGREIVDITFQTTESKGFFKRLKSRNIYNIKSPIIFLECKNITTKLTNKEYQQLYGRFDDERGKFGVLICRDKKDENEVLRQTKDRKKKGYVIVLDDKEMLKLIKLRFDEGESAIDEYFEKKMKKFLM